MCKLNERENEEEMKRRTCHKENKAVENKRDKGNRSCTRYLYMFGLTAWLTPVPKNFS